MKMYQIKSLVYLIVFVATCVAYHNLEQNDTRNQKMETLTTEIDKTAFQVSNNTR
jgi:PBP1b-binding outer membrane lipoprotein LpoB